MSDKFLPENSGLLKNLLSGKRFDIADSVGFYQAKLYIAAFTKGKILLSAKDVICRKK